MRNTKKKYIIPIIVFLLGVCALAATIYGIEREQQTQNMTKARLNAMTYAERMKADIMEGIGITDTLQQILISEDGKINHFDKVAGDMLTDSIQSIQMHRMVW